MGKRIIDKKGQIILLDRWKKSFDMLTDEQAGQMVKGIYQYQTTGEEPGFKHDLLLFFWQDVKTWLDESQEAYRQKCEQNRDNAKKRWYGDGYDDMPDMPDMSDMPEDTTAYDRMGTYANYANDNDNGKVKVNDNVKAMKMQSSDNAKQGKDKGKERGPGKENREEEAVRINPGNFKTHYQRAGKLNVETVFHLCDRRRDEIRQGNDPAEVDRGIQREIDKFKED
jgi:hypothetical protein